MLQAALKRRAVKRLISSLHQHRLGAAAVTSRTAEAVQHAVVAAVPVQFVHCAPTVGPTLRGGAVERAVVSFNQGSMRMRAVACRGGEGAQDTVGAPILVELEQRPVVVTAAAEFRRAVKRPVAVFDNSSTGGRAIRASEAVQQQNVVTARVLLDIEY